MIRVPDGGKRWGGRLPALENSNQRWCGDHLVPSKADDDVQDWLLLDVAIGKGLVVISLPTGKYQTLLVYWDPFLVKNFFFTLTIVSEILTLRGIILIFPGIFIDISICTTIANTWINDKSNRKKTKPLENLLQHNMAKEINDQINKRKFDIWHFKNRLKNRKR